MKPSSRYKWITIVLSIIFLGVAFVPFIADAANQTAPVNGNLAPTQGSLSNGAIQQENGGDGWFIRGIKEGVNWALGYIAKFILTLVSWVLALAGIILDAVLNYTVYEMGDKINKLPAIETAWRTIRDFCNIVFIFTLLYIALNTILQRDSYASKKLISSVIIAALLVNYSMFFTKLIIDVSNVVTVRFYNAIKINGETTTADGSKVGGLGAVYMTKLGLVNIHDRATSVGTGNVLVGLFMGIIFILIAAFAFFVVSILFIVRYVILLILLVFSPVMFATSVLPATKKYNQMWWDRLTAECLFAPAFMVMAWLSLQLAPMADLENKSMVDLAFNYIIVSAFMVGSIIIAKSVSTKGGAVVGMVGSQTAGRFAGYLGSKYNNLAARGANNKYTSWVNRVPLVNLGVGALDRGIRDGLKGAADAKYGGKRNYASYDKEIKDRQTELTKTYTGLQGSAKLGSSKKKLQEALAMPATTPAEIEARDAAIRDAVYGFSDKEVADLGYDLQKNPDILRNLKTSQFDALVDDKNEKIDPIQRKALKDARKKHLEDALKDVGSADPAVRAQAQAAVQRLVQQRSGSEIAGYSKDTLTKLSEAGLMSKAVSDAIDKRTDLTPDEKAKLKFASENKIFDDYIGSGTPTADQTAALERSLADLSPKEFSSMSSKYHRDERIMGMATTEQLNELMKSDNISSEDKKKILQARLRQVFDDVETLSDPAKRATVLASVGGADKIKKMEDRIAKVSADELEHIAAHKSELLNNHHFANALKSKTFEKVADSKRIINSQKGTLKEARLKPLKDAITAGNITEIQRQIKDKLDPKTLAGLDEAMVTNPDILRNLNTQVLHHMRDDTSKAAAVRRKITDLYNAGERGQIDNLHNWLNGKGRDFGV